MRASELSELHWLDVSHNQLTSAIPSGISDLPYLEELKLDGNKLTGCIPWKLTQNDKLAVVHDGLPDCPLAVEEGGALPLAISSLLDGADSRLIEARQAANGMVWQDQTVIWYEHDGSETGTGGFSYVARIGSRFVEGTVEVMVLPVNDPPVAAHDAAAVAEGSTLALNRSALLQNDSMPKETP